MNCRARRVMGSFLPALTVAVVSLSAPRATADELAPRATEAGELASHVSGDEFTPPWETPEISVETGLLWQVGSNTPLSYRLVPTQLSWRSRAFFAHELAGGGQLLVRHRVGLLATWVQQGPESHYVALHGSPSIELWNRAGTWALVGGAGGGFGMIDSRGVAGGQGQDFTFHWFARVAVEHATPRGLRFSAGVMFQHLSNGGQTDPNPGIDALGFTLGLTRAF